MHTHNRVVSCWPARFLYGLTYQCNVIRFVFLLKLQLFYKQGILISRQLYSQPTDRNDLILFLLLLFSRATHSLISFMSMQASPLWSKLCYVAAVGCVFCHSNTNDPLLCVNIGGMLWSSLFFHLLMPPKRKVWALAFHTSGHSLFHFQGMRIVMTPDEFDESLASCRHEALVRACLPIPLLSNSFPPVCGARSLGISVEWCGHHGMQGLCLSIIYMSHKRQ